MIGTRQVLRAKEVKVCASAPDCPLGFYARHIALLLAKSYVLLAQIMSRFSGQAWLMTGVDVIRFSMSGSGGL